MFVFITQGTVVYLFIHQYCLVRMMLYYLMSCVSGCEEKYDSIHTHFRVSVHSRESLDASDEARRPPPATESSAGAPQAQGRATQLASDRVCSVTEE